MFEDYLRKEFERQTPCPIDEATLSFVAWKDKLELGTVITLADLWMSEFKVEVFESVIEIGTTLTKTSD